VWNTPPARDPQFGVPTSYYAAVQLSCAATVIDDPGALIELLRRQLAQFEPDKNPDDLSEASPYGQLLGAIRGLRLDIVEVRAKFKFGGNRSPDHQRDIAARMLDRDGPMDAEASEQQRRRRESRGVR
jgi:transcriptional regulator